MIKLPKFIFKPDQKGWLKALGLHHAAIACAAIVVGHLIHPMLGNAMAMFLPGMYFGREYKEFEIRANNGFETMDFVSPLLVGLAYLYINNLTLLLNSL